jgi:hypothetical protein
MTNLLSFSYWFSIRPMPFLPTVERALLVAFAVWMLGGIVASLFLMKHGLGKTTRRALEKAAGLLTWSGLTGLIFWGFEYERIPVLSIRFFYVLLGVWIVLGVYDIVRYLRVEVPEQQRDQEERLAREKWLPKKKK